MFSNGGLIDAVIPFQTPYYASNRAYSTFHCEHYNQGFTSP